MEGPWSIPTLVYARNHDGYSNHQVVCGDLNDQIYIPCPLFTLGTRLKWRYPGLFLPWYMQETMMVTLTIMSWYAEL